MRQRTSRQVKAELFDPREWARFGWTPLPDTDARDGESRLDFEWGDAHVNFIGHGADEIPHTATGLMCQMLYCHRTHTQALLVLDAPAVIAVAPPECTFTSAEDVSSIRAFQLQPHDGIVLRRGTWHWGPFPVAGDWVSLFNVQGLRYAEDNACARLDELGVTLEVVVTGQDRP